MVFFSIEVKLDIFLQYLSAIYYLYNTFYYYLNIYISNIFYIIIKT